MKSKRTVYITLLILFSLLFVGTLIVHTTVPTVYPMRQPLAADSTPPADMGEMPQMAAMPDRGIAGTVSRLWLPIAIISALGAAGAAALLIRARKPEVQQVAEKSSMPPLDVDEDEPPHRANNQGYLVAGTCIVLAFALIIGTLPTASKDSVSVNSTVLSGKMETQTISTVLSGTGTLTGLEAVKVSIPTDITVKAYHVKNGDTVFEGDPLASVDTTEVRSAISELQNVMNALDSAIASEKNIAPSTAIKASASGRIKKIYAEKDGSVADTVYRNGALMELSLDGFMAVQIPAELEIGTSVTATLSDGTVEKGRVTAVSDGLSTITVSDQKAACDEEAIITDQSGALLGTGTLYINSPLKVVGYYGTVAGIPVSLNQKVSVNTTLVSLKDVGHTAKYVSLLERRADFEERMEKLSRISTNGQILAEADGIVSGVDKDIDYVALEPSRVRSNATPGIVFTSLLSFEGQPALYQMSEVDPQPEPQPDPDPDPDPTPAPPVSGKVIAVGENTITVKTKDGEQTVVNNGQLVFFVISQDRKLQISFQQIIVGDNVTVTEQAIVVTSDMNLDDIMGRFSGFSFGGFSSGTTTPIYETYDLSEKDVLRITPKDSFTVSVPVDELDILTIREGMEATITLDAMQDRHFTGEITRINYYGTNDGGNTKYAVEVTLPKTENMLEGMNASVKFVTSVSDPVPTIPVAALQEEGGKRFVYTTYDSKKDELGGLTEVETGISDGLVVEILSGMDENTTYYYRYADSMVYQFV